MSANKDSEIWDASLLSLPTRHFELERTRNWNSFDWQNIRCERSNRSCPSYIMKRQSKTKGHTNKLRLRCQNFWTQRQFWKFVFASMSFKWFTLPSLSSETLYNRLYVSPTLIKKLLFSTLFVDHVGSKSEQPLKRRMLAFNNDTGCVWHSEIYSVERSAASTSCFVFDVMEQ